MYDVVGRAEVHAESAGGDMMEETQKTANVG